MTQLDLLMESLHKQFNNAYLQEIDFLDVVSQLQPYYPLINCNDTQFFKQIYHQLLKQGGVTLQTCFQYVFYMAEKNRNAIIEVDIIFYGQIIAKLMEDNILTLPTDNFSKTLMENKTLNMSLKILILKFFDKTETIQIKKFRKVIYHIYNQLQNNENLDMINSLKSSSMPFRNSKVSEGSVKNQILKDVSESIELAKTYSKQYRDLSDILDVALVQNIQRQKWQTFKVIHEQYLDMQKQHKQRMNDKIHSFELQIRDKDQQILETASKIDELKQQIIEMDKQVMKLERNIQKLTSENKSLLEKIIQKSKQYQQTFISTGLLKQKFAQIMTQNKCLKQQLELEIKYRRMSSSQQIQDLQNSQLILDRISSNDFDLKQLTIKQQLDDANQKLQRLEQKYQNEILQMKQDYQIKIETLEQKINQLEKEANESKPAPVLGDEQGFRQSSFNWRMSKKYSQVQTYKLMKPPELVMNDKLHELIQSRLSVIPIQFNIDDFQQKQQSQKAQVKSIKVDIEDFYKYDYCDVSQIQTVRNLLQKQRQQAQLDYEQKYLEKRHLVFSCDIKILKQNGDQHSYTLIVGPIKVFLISGSKNFIKDQISINQIAKLVIPPISNLLIIKYGRETDMLLVTNRRKQLTQFLKNAAFYQSLVLCVIKSHNQQKVQIRQSKKKIPLSQFRGVITSPYYMSFQYSMTFNAWLQSKNMFNQSSIHKCFVVVNESGVSIFQDDLITTKSMWKQKLLIYIPIVPSLILGKLQNKKIRIGFEQKLKEHKDSIIVFKSTIDKDDFNLIINEHKRKIMETRFNKATSQKKAINYIQID